MSIDIPPEVLAAMGISVGSAAIATGIAVSKSGGTTPLVTNPPKARLFQAMSSSNDSVDVTRFQNYWLSVIAVSAYISLAVNFIDGAQALEAVSSLPSFNEDLNFLLLISHGGYLIPKSVKPDGN